MVSELDAVWEGRETSVARVRDLTLEGAFVESGPRPTEGEEARLTVLASHAPVAVRVEVVRVKDTSGFAVRFLEMDREARAAIANHLLCVSAPGRRDPSE